MTEKMWCVTEIIYQDESIAPQTIKGFSVKTAGANGDETMSFIKTGRILLPGIHGEGSSADWKYGASKSSIIIHKVINNTSIYEGEFQLKSLSGELKMLYVEKTKIKFKKYNSGIAIPF